MKSYKERSQPLLIEQDLTPGGNAGRAFRDFLVMSVAFSINHGTVSSVLSLASTELSGNLAAWSSATLWFVYTMCALFLAVPLTLVLGPKYSLFCGLGLYCFWPGTFALTLIPSIRDSLEPIWIVAIIGSAIGGIGAGWIWTAQGVYFARISEIYARANGLETTEATGFLGGIFASIYVGIEVIMRLAGSIIQEAWPEFGHTFLFIFYFVAAATGAMLILCVQNPPDPSADLSIAGGGAPTGKAAVWKKIKAISVVVKDPKVWMLAPLNVAFGFCVGYLNWYINGSIASHSVGKTKLGYVTAMIPGYAAIMAVPYAYMGKLVGKASMMIFGAICFGAIGALGLFISEEKLLSGGWTTLIIIYLLMGSGRTVFESTNKSVFADFFPTTKEGAFAMVGVQSGLSGFLGFIIFSKQVHVEPKTAAGIIMGLGITAVVSLFFAFQLNNKQKRMLTTNGIVV